MPIHHEHQGNGDGDSCGLHIPKQIDVPQFKRRPAKAFLELDDQADTENEKELYGLVRGMGKGVDDLGEAFEKVCPVLQEVADRIFAIDLREVNAQRERERQAWLKNLIKSAWGKAIAIILLVATPFLYGFLGQAGTAFGKKFFGE